MEKPYWEGKHYAFFSNKECEYFPWIKDCTNCQLPHKAQNYGYVTGKYSELAELMKKIREEKDGL